MIFQAIPCSMTMIFFIDQKPAKNNIFEQVFLQGCFQNMSTNLPITTDLCTLTEEILDENFP